MLLENESEITPELEDKEEKAVLREKIKQKDKLDEYKRKLTILGNRNSYSRTDKDVTFMHMKEDAMRNGQTKPCYNLLTSTENQLITFFAFYPNPTDTQTMHSLLSSFKEKYDRFVSTIVTDSGYGSEVNYRYMEENGMEAYVKYNRFHIEHRMHYTPSPFSADAMYYNADGFPWIGPLPGDDLFLMSVTWPMF